MKQYTVIWRKIGEEQGAEGLVACVTNDVKEAYEYARQKLPYGYEAFLYNGDVLEYKTIKA